LIVFHVSLSAVNAYFSSPTEYIDINKEFNAPIDTPDTTSYQ
jgi:hypothetical protein